MLMLLPGISALAETAPAADFSLALTFPGFILATATTTSSGADFFCCLLLHYVRH